jgi:hypothetical protein
LEEGEDFVAASRAEALKVEGDVGVADVFEVGEKFGAEGVGSEFREVGGGDFDAGEFLVVADAEVGEASVVEEGFAFFDLGEGAERDGGAIGYTAGEAGEGGFFPVGDIEVFGEGANVRFGHAGVEEWGTDGVFVGGFEARAEVAGIVGVDAIENGPDVTPLLLLLGGKLGEFGVKLGFTKVAAVRGVGGIIGAVHFRGVEELEGGVEDGGEFFDAGEFAGGQGRADAGGGEDVGRAQGVEGKFEDESRVYAGAEGDDDVLHGAE